MPDIIVSCPECGREHRVSEYVTAIDLRCLTCGAQLALPRRSAKTILAVRKAQAPSLAAADEEAPLARLRMDADVSTAEAAPKVEVHKRGVKVRGPSMLWGWLAFLVVTAVMGLIQYKAGDLGGYLRYYVWARNLLAAGVFLLVVLVAFEDSLGQGALCLFIPPYCLFYITSSVESYVLKGAFWGVLLGLGAELYFIPHEALFADIGEGVRRFIAVVDSLIQRASKPPV